MAGGLGVREGGTKEGPREGRAFCRALVIVSQPTMNAVRAFAQLQPGGLREHERMVARPSQAG